MTTFFRGNKTKHIIRNIGAVWGMLGIMFIVSYALYRLSFLAAEAFTETLTVLQWIVLIVWCAYMIHSEGIKGFAKSFSPRAAARAQYISRHGNWHQILFAPIFCFGYYQTNRRRLIGIYALTLGIIGLIIIIRLMVQPWRGIIDSGVVLGLSIGLVTLFYFSYKAWLSGDYITDPAVSLDQNTKQEKNKA